MAWASTSVASDRQSDLIREWCDANGMKILRIFNEAQMDKFGPVDKFPALDEAFALCKEHQAVFIYVGLQRLRKNPNLKRRIAEFKKSVGSSMLEEIPGGELIEYIRRTTVAPRGGQRSAGEQSFNRMLIIPPSKEGPISCWAKDNAIDMRRLRSLAHLNQFRIGRLIMDAHNLNYSDKDIADELNDHYLLTVYGKRWTKETVRKARETLLSDEYKGYCAAVRQEGVMRWQKKPQT